LANASASTTADITARSLSVTATGVNKVYDGSTTATVTLSDDRVNGDSLSASYTSASFANKSVGTNKTVTVSGISISGADAGNYSANTSASATANITAKALTVSGITAADKVYDATTSATLSTATAALVGVISGDTVTLNTASATGGFADKNVGTGKVVTVSALSLSGADAANYTLTQPTTSASISKAGLTVKADNKSRAAGQSNPTLTASYSGFVGGETLATSGVTGSPALSTTTTNVAGTYLITAALGTLDAANYSFSFSNGTLTVTAAAASKLIVQTQPSSTAVAGVPFAQQPQIRIEDAYGNLRTSDNSTVVTAARSSGSGALQGTLSATAVNGVATFANLSHQVANSINLSFSGSGLTGATSGNILISPAAFTKLQLLVPGESAVPGTASGKSGTPSGQIVGAGVEVIVNGVDAFWNVVNSVDDTIGLTSSDATATLPPAAALIAGTKTLTAFFNTSGNFTVTASDLTDAGMTPSTSPAIAVSPAQFTPATGGSAISADATGGAWTTLTGPTYTENNPGEVGTGTIILNAPSGFLFDTGGTAPTVSSVKLSGGGNNPVQGSVTSVTTTQIVYTVTAASANPSQLTWQNVRVRPTAGTPLASGNLSRSGTASVVGLPAGARLGVLREVPGAASTLAIQTQPSATATAGVAFAQQPLIRLQDQFGNLCTNNSSTVVSAARAAGSGTLQGTTNLTAVAGLVTYANLSHNVATNITLNFSASGLSGTNSSVIAVSAAAADRLVFTTQPGSAIYGSALNQQPVLKTQDPLGNDSTVGLGTSKMVSLTVNTGSGTLLGTTSLDIGTAAGNGLASFSGLQVSAAGMGKQLTASASGLASALSSSFDVTPATVTGGITANSKVYDGTTAATIATRTLSGVLGSDNVSLSGGTASFASKTVGTAKTVTAIGLTLSGADAANYQLASTSASTTVDITARPLVVSATGANKPYDGTTSATVTLSDNRVAGDSLTTSYTSASFANKNVGTAKTVSVSGISLSGTDAANYTANTSASTTADITARSLSVTATGVNKVYDGTTSATVTLSDNRLAGDSLSTSYTSASFSNKNVGTNKTVSVSGIALSGADASNYTANTTASTTANISARALTVSATGVNKAYDGTTTTTVTLSDDRLAGDSLSTSYTSASFANKNVGISKTVSVSGIALSGTDAGNYTANATASTTADITTRALTISATGVNKVYDGTTSATVTLSDNRVVGDSLSTSYTSASFADPMVGAAKTVSVGGISLSGLDAGNYTANTTASATANITAASLTTLVTANNKVYDGTTSATIATRALNGVLGSDDVSLSGGTASFASKIVGTNKTVSVTGLSLSGADAANYQLASSTASTTANITGRSLSVTATGVNKVYNGTTSATATLSDNRVAGDSLTTSYASASFADKNVGTAKTVSVSGISISGTDAANYSANSSTTTTADITVRSLTVSATASNKVYDATTSATITLSDNRVAGDSLSTSYASASFASKTVGTGKTVSVSGISISGTDAGNYTANTTASTTANITAKALTVSGITAADKVYDANTSAALNTASATLSGVVSGDSVLLNAASATGAFADKNVGTGKVVSVSALSLSGADAANYTLTQPTTTASISKAGLTVKADDKSRAAGQSNPTLTASYSGFVGGETLATSGVTGSPTLSTTTTNVVGVYPITAALGTLSAANYSFSFSNGTLTVTAAAASKLIVQTQPSSTAVAGVAFAQQPQIRIEDAYGNLRTGDNSTVVTAARNSGSGALQGTLSATAVNGVAPFANLSHQVANSINLSFSGSGLTGATSGNILISPAAFTKLQLLVPGESAAPGTASGKSGTPIGQIVGTGVEVLVNGVDAFWNVVNSVDDTIGLTSSDATATLPPAAALIAGTKTLTAFFNTNGNFTVTASDLTDAGKTSSTSPAIAVGPAQFTAATGGGAIPADGAVSGSFTSLSGPTYSENNAGEVGTGTMILNAPAGFVFDTGGTAPTVSSVKLSGSGNSPVQGSVTSVTTTQIVYTVTAASANPSQLTWQNVRVRPTAGTPLVSGNLWRSGTAAVVGLSTNVNLGTLREVAGAASDLVILTQPSATAMAGVPFGQQPVLQVLDQFGNVRNAANGVTNGDTVSAARLAGSGTLQGTTNMASANGIVTFTNLSLNGAGTSTIQFTAGSATEISDPIVVGAGIATRLAFATQPGNATAGSAFGTQPELHAQDDFGNDTTAGLPASLNVAVSLTSGTGPLLGTTTLDIGTAAGNGIAAFSDLEIDAAGTGKQLTAVASGLSNAVSSTFTANAGPAASLALQTQPPVTATAGVAFSPATVIRVLDAFGNLRATDNSTVVTAARNAGTASLQGTTSVTAVNGLATFSNLSYTKAETITIAFNSGTLTGVTSSSVTVNPGAATKLAIQTQPSATATAGVAFAQQPAIRIEDAYGNLRSSDNSTVVTAARNAGSGTLQGTLTATAVNGVATFASLSHNVATTINLSFTASGLTSATSSNIVVSPAAFTKLQLLVPGETASPGTLTGKSGTPTARTAGTAFNVTVNAVDAFWNLATNVTDTVSLSSTDTNALLGADTALVNSTGSFSVTFNAVGSQTLTVSDSTDGIKSANTSPSITVNAGAFAKLQLLLPGETAAPGTVTGKTGSPTPQTAGAGYSVTVRSVDASWNLVSSANTVGLTCNDPNDILPANAALSAGVKTFSLTNKTAGSWTVTATNVTDGTKTSASSALTVNSGAFAKLQLLVPGEVASPGSSTGKTGSPTAQTAGTPLNVTVNAVDANWNVVSTIADTVGITSSDANATLPSNTALVSGTQSLSVTLNTAGTRTLTASDVTDGTKSPSTSPSLTVNAGNFAKLQLLVPGETAAPGTASGKTGTPTTQTAGTAFNVTANAVDANWNLVTTVTHTVGISSTDSAATLPANAALVSGTKAFSVTLRTSGSQTVTATDITDGTKTPGTSGPISVSVGTASKLVIQTQPSSTATAGVAFAQQPVIYVTDAAGNPVSTNGLVITAARGTGTGTLQGTLSASTVGGIATFTNLSYNVAETITLNFTSGTLTNATSSNVVVGAAAFAKLQLLAPGETAAPGSASGKTGTPSARTAGTAFNVTVNAVDAFWNLVNSATDTVDLSSSDANATLPADTALVNGTGSLSVTFKSAGSQTLTASDVTDGSKTSNTSPAITVNAGAFAKMQILVPGESAAPGSASGKSGMPTAQSAGTGFTLTVNAVDANWNLVSSAPANTISITTTDPNDTQPANNTLASGTRNFTVTFKTAGSWTVTANNVTDATKTANTTPAITANPGAFTKLQILVPGESAAPGTATGKTGAPFTQVASSPFNITVNAVDANWNVVSTVADTVTIDSSDANAMLPIDTALVAGSQTFSVTPHTAGTATFTASDVTDGTKTASTSPSIMVGAGNFVKLLVLVPGETAAPGTTTGKTGTPTAQAAGTAFNVTVRSVDADWNLVSSIHTVGITSTDTNATLPANGSLSAGTRTMSITLRSLGSQTVTATDLTDGSKNPSTSPAITVNVGAANKLVIQTQPSSTATAGVAFAQQPVIYVTDTLGNLVTNDNGRIITAARSAGTGTLQGTLTATTVNGIATFTNLSHNVATTITINFGASGLTSATSSNIVVSPSTANQLLFTTQPGGTSRTGSPLATQPVVTSQDAFGNTSAVGLPASFNVSLALTSGSGTLLGTTSLDIGAAAGNGTATFTNVECSDAGSNKVLTASAPGFSNAVSSAFFLGGVERATGGTAIPSSYAGTTYTNLTGPVYYEVLNADAGADGTTIILNAPSGFNFDIGGTAPTVRVDRLAGGGNDSKNINAVPTGTSVAVTSRTTTQITFTVTNASSGGVNCSLTWQNIRVRPSASSPLASGNITKTGTAAMAAVTASSTSFGRLNEVGPAARLVIQTQPSSTATAGVVFATQPVILLQDSAGNLVGSDNSTIVTAARSAGSGTLQGTLTARATNGVATFTNLSHNVATNITISFTSGSLTSTTSTAIAVSPAAAAQLAFTTQPANSTIGSALATQPVVRSRDQFGNNSTVGLGASKDVTVTLSAGTGPLLGTTTLDIGASAGNGIIAFTDLQIDSAGTNKQLTASGSGLSSAVSSVFSVAKQDQIIAFGALASKTYGDAPFTVSATASSGLPVSFSIVSGPATISGNLVTITGAGSVTVRASQAGDANWNAAPSVNQSFSVAQKLLTGSITANSKIYDGTTAATIATRTLSGVVGSDNVSLTGGTATFANKNAGNGKTVTATGLSLSGTSAGNYQLASTSATTAADITARTLTMSASALNKMYDGSTSATVTLSDNRLAGDSLSTSYASANFANKNVGTAKSVSVSGITVSGADAANYSANTTASTTADITARTLTVSATGVNKVYDGTSAATVTLSDDRVAGDSLSASYTSASFAAKNVGMGKTVNVSGISVTGADAANYSANTTASTTADITARTLTVSATGMNKVYDGTSAATVTLMDDRVAGDTLSASYASASFADKNVGTGKAVNVSGISVTGADAANYSANTTASTTADITARTLTVSAAGVNKVYDGTSAATVTLSDDRVAGDSLSAGYTSASFADKNVGTGKTVNVSGISVTGGDAANYSANTTASTTADITAKGLVVSGVIASTKVYDGTTAATINLDGATWTGLVSGDAVALNTNAVAGTFASPTAETNKLVTVSGLILGGADAGQYILLQTTTIADITPAALFVVADDKTKVYGEANPPLTASYLGFVNGEDATVLSGSADLGTPVTTDTPEGTYPITVTLGSLSATNYTFTFQDGQFTVMGAAPSEASAPFSGEEALTIAQPATLTGIRVVPNGIKISFTGSAGQTYQIVRASELLNSGTVWTSIGSATTDAAGNGEFTDTNALPTHAFYRAVSLEPNPQPAPAR
jgi:hypothetical protein